MAVKHQFVLLLLGAIAIAQAPPAASSKSQKELANCTVSGRVVTAEGAPIKSARVALLFLPVTGSPHDHIYAALTDSDGRFEMKKIAPGRYRFMVSHIGFVGQEYKSKGRAEGAFLALTPGQEVDDIVFRLVRAAVVTGVISDEAGDPMANVVVTALRRPTAEEKEDSRASGRTNMVSSLTALSDDRGEYRIYGLKPGDYYLMANVSTNLWARNDGAVDTDPLDQIFPQALGNVYAPVYYPGAPQLSQAQPVSLHAGDEIEANFTLLPVKTVEVTGRVIGPGQSPATRVQVELSLAGADAGSNTLFAVTDDEGKFFIKGVPAGSYVLAATYAEESGHYRARQKIEVGDTNVSSVIIALGRGARIDGRVLTAAASPAQAYRRLIVSLTSVDDNGDQGGGSAKVNKEDGTFEFVDVADGDYAFRAYGMERGWYVKSVRMGGEDVLQKGLHVEQSKSAGAMEIVLASAGAALEGLVTDHDSPVPAAMVRLNPDPDTPYSSLRSSDTVTDQNGHFVFDSVAPGKYLVTAKLPSASEDLPPISSKPKAVTLAARDHQTVQLTLTASHE